jgi:hypothetical protein
MMLPRATHCRRRFTTLKTEPGDAKAIAAAIEARDSVQELLAQADDIEFRYTANIRTPLLSARSAYVMHLIAC